MQKTSLTALSLLLTLGGCGTSAAPTQGMMSDAGDLRDSGSVPSDGSATDSSASGQPLDCGDCVFVLGTLAIPDFAAMMTEGLDLDGVVSEGASAACNDQADSVDSQGNGGIDNQLALIASVAGSASTNQNITDAIHEGSALVLVDLDGVDSTEDTDVTFKLLIGTLRPPSACTAAGNECGRGYLCNSAADSDGQCDLVASCTEAAQCPALHACSGGVCVANIANAQGRVEGGQTFPIDAASFEGMDPNMRAVVQATGRIAGGRLEVSRFEFPLDFLSEDGSVSLRLVNGQLRADVTSDALSNGRLGGALRTAELDALGMSLAPDRWNAQLRASVLGLADLEPNAAGNECAALSAGFTFTGVTAHLGNVVR